MTFLLSTKGKPTDRKPYTHAHAHSHTHDSFSWRCLFLTVSYHWFLLLFYRSSSSSRFPAFLLIILVWLPKSSPRPYIQWLQSTTLHTYMHYMYIHMLSLESDVAYYDNQILSVGFSVLNQIHSSYITLRSLFFLNHNYTSYLLTFQFFIINFIPIFLLITQLSVLLCCRATAYQVL